MSENEIHTSDYHIIFNGGDPLPGTPGSWNAAHEWEYIANEDKYDDEPKWKFDCGFKLDFDGPIISISSRFYPPAKYYGPKWDGTISVLLLGKKVKKIKLECDTLDELKLEAEKMVAELVAGITL